MSTLKTLIAQSLELEIQAAEAAKTEKTLRSKIKDIHAEIIAEMEALGGAQEMSFDVGSVLIQDKKLPNVEDWDQLYEFIKANNAFYLLHRRVSQTAMEETIAMTEVPGVSIFTDKKVIVRPPKAR